VRERNGIAARVIVVAGIEGGMTASRSELQSRIQRRAGGNTMCRGNCQTSEALFERMWPTIRIQAPDPESAAALTKAINQSQRR
jgi:hypothetical protein